MNFLNFFFIAVHKEYQSEKSPIIDSQKSKKTRRKLLKMSHMKTYKVDQMFCNNRYCVLCSVTPAWLIISSALVSCCYTAVWLCLILILVLGHSNEDELVQTSTRGYCNPIAYSVELSTNLREVSQCPNKAPTRAFSSLKVPSSSFKNKNLLRHYAKQAFKHGK